MKTMKLAPSLFAADFSNLAQEITKLEAGGADYLHIDVMDGYFVPNLSLGPQLVKSIRNTSKMTFDVHLMVNEPRRYIDDFVKAGADIITIHLEAKDSIEECIKLIKSHDVKVCISIKPQTPIDSVKQYLPLLDMVLVMSVEPGFGGQSFIPQTIERIQQLAQLIDKFNPTCEIEVDGGVSLKNILEVKEAGANVFVTGSALFNTSNLTQNVKEYKNKIIQGGSL